jgi:tyrosinase
MFTRRRLLAAAAATIAAPAASIAAPSPRALERRPPTCEITPEPRVRRDASLMAPDDPFFSDYAAAIEAMHNLGANDLRNWRNQSLIHLSHCTHTVIDFFHWHRHYIYYFERICGALIGKPNFALAYWDWSERPGFLPDPFFDVDRLNVAYWNDPSNAQSEHWGGGALVTTVGVRGLARGQALPFNLSGAFDPERLNAILSQSNFDIFWRALENGPHSLAHILVGGRSGHMGNGMSSLDPIFWLHHCNVDRLWSVWQSMGNITPDPNFSYANNFVDDKGVLQTSPNSTNALDIAAFGYVYEMPTQVDPSLPPPIVTSDPNPAPSPVDAIALTAPTTIVTATANIKVRINAGAGVRLAAPDLLKLMFEPRIFKGRRVNCVPRHAVEQKRIVAKLEIEPPSDQRVMVAVFVNCPYLSPTTPTTDPHCAGVFAFFGIGHSGPMKTAYVDLSKPLRSLASDGLLDPRDIVVQLMPLPLADNVSLNESIGVGSVTLLAT